MYKHFFFKRLPVQYKNFFILSYYGVNDPVAEKLMRRAAAMPALPPPEDKTISTLYIGNLSDGIQEETLRSHFYQFGEIR